MQVVNLRELRRDLAEVVEALQISGQPALVTKSGRLVAVISPVDEAELGRHLLAQSTRFLADLAQAATRSEQQLGTDAPRALTAARRRPRRASVPSAGAAG
jgi:prevent-host-death family protein